MSGIEARELHWTLFGLRIQLTKLLQQKSEWSFAVLWQEVSRDIHSRYIAGRTGVNLVMGYCSAIDYCQQHIERMKGGGARLMTNEDRLGVLIGNLQKVAADLVPYRMKDRREIVKETISRLNHGDDVRSRINLHRAAIHSAILELVEYRKLAKPVARKELEKLCNLYLPSDLVYTGAELSDQP